MGMKRRKAPKGNRSNFSKTAIKTNKKNVAPRVQSRGGIRL